MLPASCIPSELVIKLELSEGGRQDSIPCVLWCSPRRYVQRCECYAAPRIYIPSDPDLRGVRIHLGEQRRDGHREGLRSTPLYATVTRFAGVGDGGVFMVNGF